MLPILLSLGPISISTFSLFLSFAFITGSYFTWHYGRAETTDEKILDYILVLTLSCLFFGRLFYILFNFSLFDYNLLKMLHLFKYPGIFLEWGLLFSILCGSYFSLKNKINPFSLLDALTIGLALAFFLGETGCFLGGCVLGNKTDFFLGLNYGREIGKRFPVSLYSAILFLLIFLLVFFLERKKNKNRNHASKKDWNLRQEGLTGGIFLCLFAITRFALGFLIEEKKIIFSLSLAQYSNLIILLLAIIFLIRYINWSQILFNIKSFRIPDAHFKIKK